MNKYSKAFGKFLKTHLRSYGYTQLKLANKLDMDASDMSQKISRSRKFTLDDFIRICDQIGVTDYNVIINEIKKEVMNNGS